MKKIINKNKLPIHAFGSLIENPNTTLMENQIALVKASQAGAKNGWAQGTKIFGNLAQQIGSSMMNSKGAATTTPGGDVASTEGWSGDVNSFMSNNKDDVNSGMGLMNVFSQFLAMGGTVPNMPVEVEGDEAGQTPTGQMINFKGPSHEQGGIPISLPAGTEIYSDRIKVDGVSMADRKNKREKKTVTLEALLEKNNNDALTSNSLKRTKQVNDKEEQADTQIQDVVSKLLNKNTAKHAYGDTVGDDPTNPLARLLNSMMLTNNVYGGYGNGTDAVATNTPGTNSGATDFLDTFNTNPGTTNTDSKPADIFGGITFGDAIGLAGNLKSTFGPMANTKANRAGDTPNINAFADYGKDGLNTLDESKQYINQVRDNTLKGLDLARTTSVKRNNNSARGVNTQRALNLATDAQLNNAEGDTMSAFAQQMMGVLQAQAGMENQRDSVVMQGEQARDLADRQDRDNFFSQMAQDISTMGTGLQETGKDVNAIKERQVMENLLNQLSAYGITIDKDGNLSNPKKKK